MALLPVTHRRESPTTTRWDPLEDFPQRVADMFRSWPPTFRAEMDFFAPMADIEETDVAYTVELELPGVDKADVTIEVSGRRLVVTGERKERERTGVVRERNRMVGKFRYELLLPGDITVEAVEAKLLEGVLTLTAPKAVGTQARKITLS